MTTSEIWDFISSGYRAPSNRNKWTKTDYLLQRISQSDHFWHAEVPAHKRFTDHELWYLASNLEDRYRQAIFLLSQAGFRKEFIAELMSVSKNTAYYWIRYYPKMAIERSASQRPFQLPFKLKVQVQKTLEPLIEIEIQKQKKTVLSRFSFELRRMIEVGHE